MLIALSNYWLKDPVSLRNLDLEVMWAPCRAMMTTPDQHDSSGIAPWTSPPLSLFVPSKAKESKEVRRIE
jgi:hypothetical protein